jgi:hypothetical protein
MALKQDTKDKLKKYGLDVDKLIDAVKADAEVDYAVADDVTVIKNTDLETRDNNNKATGKTDGEKEGEKKGKELAAKAFKKKFNLAETVPADIDKVVEAVNTELAKGDDGLKQQVKLLQTDKETLAAQLEQEKKTAKAATQDAQLISLFPSGRTEDLQDNERLVIVKNVLTFEEVEGKTVVKRNGEILRDATTKNPLDPKQAVSDYFTERKWVPEGNGGAGGRGGGNNPAGGGTTGVKKYSQFKEKWMAENPGKNEISDEFVSAVNKHAKETTDFDMYN